MSEDKDKQKPEELQDEQLDEVTGGGKPFTGSGRRNIKND